MPAAPLLNQVANAFLAGESSVETIADRLAFVLGRRWRFLTPLVERYLSAFSGRPRPRRRGVIRFLLEDAIFQRAWRKRLHKLSIPGWLAAPSPMQPVPAAVTWNLPAIETAGDLAAWLDVSPTELDWFADLKGLTSKLPNPRLNHYHCRLFVKRSGGLAWSKRRNAV